MAKKMRPKPRKATDSTLRNVRAANKRLVQLEGMIENIPGLLEAVQQLEARLTAAEAQLAIAQAPSQEIPS